MDSGLYIVSTPIGNLKDITLRALEVLKNVDFILCEDTRRARILLDKYEINSGRLISFHKFSEKRKSEMVLKKIRDGLKVALVTDSGTPAISDPGAFIVRKCLETGVRVYPIPGPSALCAGVSCSGINGGFVFLGFLGKKKKDIERVVYLKRETGLSVVFFESPNRIVRTLKRLLEYGFEGELVIWREMTKIYEEVIVGKVGDILAKFEKKNNIRGEFIIIIR